MTDRMLLGTPPRMNSPLVSPPSSMELASPLKVDSGFSFGLASPPPFLPFWEGSLASQTPQLKEIPGFLTRVEIPEPRLASAQPLPPRMQDTTGSWATKNYFKANFQKLAQENRAFRRVVYTGPKNQIVLMRLAGGETIDREVHDDTQQDFFIQEGSGYLDVVNQNTGFDERVSFGVGDMLVIPPGTIHQVTALTELKLVTMYSPPEHPPGLVQEVKPHSKNAQE